MSDDLLSSDIKVAGNVQTNAHLLLVYGFFYNMDEEEAGQTLDEGRDGWTALRRNE